MRFFHSAIVSLALTSVISVCSCGSNDKKEKDQKETTAEQPAAAAEKGPATKLEGAWEIKRAEGMMSETNVGTVYEFEGSKLSFGKGGYKNPGKTEVTDSTFSFQADGNELKFMYNYRFNGDTLVVEMQKGSGQVFYMVKQ